MRGSYFTAATVGGFRGVVYHYDDDCRQVFDYQGPILNSRESAIEDAARWASLNGDEPLPVDIEDRPDTQVALAAGRP